MAEPRQTLRSRYDALTDRLGKYSAENAAKRTAQAQYEGIQTPLAESIERLRGEQVGRGRLNTGFGYEDEDRLVRDIHQDLNRRIAENSLAAQGYELQARGLEGDLVSGGLDREQAEKNAKKKRRGGLFGALGSIAGTIIAPGVGTYLGGMIGNAAGQYI